MKWIYILLLLAGAAQAQYLATQSTQLETKELTWIGSTGPVSAHSGDSVKAGIPLSEADGIVCSGGCTPGAVSAVPTNLRLENSAHTQLPTQFRVLATWPRTGNAKWVLIDSQSSQSAGATDYSIFLCKTSVSSCGATGGNTSGTLAVDNGTTITVTTGAATFIVQKANFDLFHDVLIGATHVVLAAGHGANDGLVLMGPATGGSMPAQVSCLTGSNPDITQCTTPYLSNADASSTCTIEENGPLRAVLKCTGDFKNGSTVYMHWTVRETFYQGKTSAAVEVSLRNADSDACVATNACSNNYATAYKMFRQLEARLTMNLAGGTRSVTFAGAPSGSGTSTTFATATAALNSANSGDQAYIYQAFSSLEQWGDWLNAANCNGSNFDWCVASYIARTTGTNYAQNGWTIQSTQTITGANVGSSTTAAGGWSDLQDTNGTGVELGVYQFSPYWPKSLEYRLNGKEARIGLWPDQAEWTAACTAGFTDGTASPCHNTYALAWPHYSTQDIFFNFHATALSSPADAFLKFQHPLIFRAAPGGSGSTCGSGGTNPCSVTANGTTYNMYADTYYNKAVDATSGLYAMGAMEMLNPLDEDNYYKTLTNQSANCASSAGTCIPEIGSTGLANGATPLVFRVFNWGNSGGGNQHDFAWADDLIWLQRGLPGYYVYAKQFYRMIEEKSLPRSDFSGGWRGSAMCPANNCPGLIPSDGFPGPRTAPAVGIVPVNLQYDMRNYIQLQTASDGDHQHGYGFFNYYFMTGDENAKEQAGQGFKDEFLNQKITLNNPSLTSPPTQITVTRHVGHHLASVAQLSEFMRSVGDSDADTVTTPTALLSGDNAVAYAMSHNVFMSGIGEAEPGSGCGWTTTFYVGLACSHGINRKRGLTWFGTEADSTSCDPTHLSCNEGTNSPPWAQAIRLAKPFMLGILSLGMQQYILAADDVRGVGWVAGQNANGNGTVPAINAAAAIPADTLFGDMFVRSLHYAPSKAATTEGFVNESGIVSTNGTAVTWGDGQQFIAGMASTGTFKINDQTFTVSTFNSATSLTLSSTAGVQINVPYSYSATGWSNISTVGTPYYVAAEDFLNTTPGQCSGTSTRTACNLGHGNSAIKDCFQGCKPLEYEALYSGLGDVAGSVYDMASGNNTTCTLTNGCWQAIFEITLEHDVVGQAGFVGPQGDQSHYMEQRPINYILHSIHDSTRPTALKPITLASSTGCTTTGNNTVSCTGQTSYTLSWTPPSDVSAFEGVSLWLKYTSDGTDILPWLGFNNYNTVATYPACVVNATPDPANDGSYVSGCWLNDPAANSNFWAATDVPVEPTNTGSFTISSLNAGLTYHFALNYYGNGASAPTTFPLTVTVSLNGNGTVTSSPAGINTSSGQTASYTNGTTVILSQTPDPLFHFVSWGGDCSGSGGCSITESAGAAHFVSANYAATTLTPTGEIR